MNTFFVMAEFSLMRVRRSQLDTMVDKEVKSSRKVRTMPEYANDYLSIC